MLIDSKPAKAGKDWTVSMEWVAGGARVAVIVKDSLGCRAYTRTFQFETEARVKFDSLKA